MAYHCFKCSADLKLSPGERVGRRDACPGCGADIHVCRNCVHHDRTAYNECREPQADRVLEKDRSNFCELFSLRSGAPGAAAADSKTYLKGLDDLFKK
jgi:DNA-directed RNA polymerase subunit RPC12/RpoP